MDRYSLSLQRASMRGSDDQLGRVEVSRAAITNQTVSRSTGSAILLGTALSIALTTVLAMVPVVQPTFVPILQPYAIPISMGVMERAPCTGQCQMR